MNKKYEIDYHLYLNRVGNSYVVNHGSQSKSRIAPFVTWDMSVEWEGERLEYKFRNLVPHNFSGHFNTLEYDKQMKVLELYKRFN